MTRPDTDRHEPTALVAGAPPDLDGLVTEATSPEAAELDLRTTRELVGLLNDQDATVPAVVGAAADDLAELVDVVVERIRGGGRLIYVGAGTSGRLAALDAAECESTFATAPDQVVALVAGDASAGAAAQDAAEDDDAAGAAAVAALGVDDRDVVVGVTASGRTPYVLGAVRAANTAGAWTAGIVSVPDSELARLVRQEVALVVGPELVAGSTRLKAGTAQKLALNTISTAAMIRLGKSYRGLMVDVASTNDKLRARARRVVVDATGAGAEEADAALAAADGSAKVAIVSLLARVDADGARALLLEARGSVRKAVGP